MRIASHSFKIAVARNSIKRLRMLRHPNVVKFVDTFEVVIFARVYLLSLFSACCPPSNPLVGNTAHPLYGTRHPAGTAELHKRHQIRILGALGHLPALGFSLRNVIDLSRRSSPSLSTATLYTPTSTWRLCLSIVQENGSWFVVFIR